MPYNPNNYTTVNLPIRIPKGNYCWNPEADIVCPHYDNEYAVSSCGLDLGRVRDEVGDNDKWGIPIFVGALKPEECLALTEVVND